MSFDTDVFIVGGGPASLAAAIAARQRGLDVIVADSSEPPIDKACGEGLMPDTLAALRELGIEVNDCEGYAFRGILFLGQGVEVEANFPDGQGIGVRRLALHRKLVEQARAVGVSFLWKTPITGLCPDGILIRGRVIAARWIVGADGIRSQVRRWAGLETQTVGYAFRRHFCVKTGADCMELYWGRSAQAHVTPVGNKQVCVVLMSRDESVRFATIATHFPQLAKHLDQAGSAIAERGAITLTHRYERLYTGRITVGFPMWHMDWPERLAFPELPGANTSRPMCFLAEPWDM